MGKRREIIQDILLNFFWNFNVIECSLFDHPFMVQKLFGGPSFLNIFSKTLFDEIFCIGTNMLEPLSFQIAINKLS
jgi:hypothetical protein